MGLIERITNIFKRHSSPVEEPAATVMRENNAAAAASPARTGVFSLLTGSGEALSVATAYRCVNLLSESVASLPLIYKRLKGDIFVDDATSRLSYLLTVEPVPDINAFDFWKTVIQYILLRGNAYIVPVYDPITMDFARLALVDPSTVSYDAFNGTYTIFDLYAGISGKYDESEVIHLKNYSRDGRNGLSTLGFARTVLDIATAGDSETRNRFVNGGNVRGIISNDTSIRGFGEYQDEQLNKTATDVDGRFRSGERIVSLPGQVQFSPISLSSTDMQFLESRKFTVRDICRFFNVPPSFVYDDTSNNYKSAEMANAAFLSTSLNPLLRKIEIEMLRKLVPPSLALKRKFEFDRFGFNACDLDSKVKYQAQTIAAGLYTVNEWRRKENKPAVKGGDTVLVSANLKAIDAATATPAASTDVEPINTNKDEE